MTGKRFIAVLVSALLVSGQAQAAELKVPAGDITSKVSPEISDTQKRTDSIKRKNKRNRAQTVRKLRSLNMLVLLLPIVSRSNR